MYLRFVQVQPSDYLSGIALRFGVGLQQLLLKNVATIRDLDQPLTGKRLLVCDIQSRESQTTCL